jgi:hypothetical protein
VSRRGWTIVAVVAALALLGGGAYELVRATTSSPSAASWASSVCTSVASWETQTKTIATSIGGLPTPASIKDKLTQIEAATTTMVNEIKAAQLPQTADSQTAKGEIDALVQDTKTTWATIKTQAASLTLSDPAGLATGVANIATEAKDLVTKAQQTMTNLKSLGSDLGNAIANDSTCRSLH